VSLEKMIESRIQDAVAAGLFSGLPGEGRPLAATEDEGLAGDNWLGFKMLKDANILPAWLELAKEIETDSRALDAIDARHAEWVDLARGSGNWERYRPAIERLRTQFGERARALRLKQDRFNVDAPGIRLERPGIWVEHHLERLEARERVSGD
jgi:hypothetical protein